MGADSVFVGLCAPPRLVGYDQVSVLELRRLGEHLLVPGQAIDVDFHERRLGVAAAKCAFIIVAKWP